MFLKVLVFIFSLYGVYIGIGGLFGKTVGVIAVVLLIGGVVIGVIEEVKKGLKKPSATDNPSDPSEDEQGGFFG